MLDGSQFSCASATSHASAHSRRRGTSRSEERASLERDLITRHVKLAERIAHTYTGAAGDPRDIRQVALLGLVKAAQRFDPDRGFPFVAFASPTIAGEIKRHLRDVGWLVRPPRAVQELGMAATAVTPELEQSLGRTPTPTELALHMSVDVDCVKEALAGTRGMFAASLDDLGDTASGGEAPHDPIDAAAMHLDVRDAVAGLCDKDQHIVHMRFVEGRTQREIAELLVMSQMQVSRALSRALATLRGVLSPTNCGSEEVSPTPSGRAAE